MVQDRSQVATPSSKTVTTATTARMPMATLQTTQLKSAIEPTTTQPSQPDTLQLPQTRLPEDRPTQPMATRIKQLATPKTGPRSTSSMRLEPLARTPQLEEVVNKTDTPRHPRELHTTHKRTMMGTGERTGMAEMGQRTRQLAAMTSQIIRRSRRIRSRRSRLGTTFSVSYTFGHR